MYVPWAQLVHARQVRLAGVLNWPTGQFAQTVFVVGVPATDCVLPAWANRKWRAAQRVLGGSEGTGCAVTAGSIGGRIACSEQVLAGYAGGEVHAGRGGRAVIVPGARGADELGTGSALAGAAGWTRRAASGRAAGGGRRLVGAGRAGGRSRALCDVRCQRARAAGTRAARAIELGARRAGDVRAGGASSSTACSWLDSAAW